MGGFLDNLFGKKEKEEPDAVGPQKAAAVATDAAKSDAEPIHVSDGDFDELVLNSPVPVLVDFWAPWCGPCRMIAPIVEELAQAYDGRAVIAKLNTDENMAVASKLGIMGIPTMILFKDGQEFDRVVGYVPRRDLEDKLNAMLN